MVLGPLSGRPALRYRLLGRPNVTAFSSFFIYPGLGKFPPSAGLGPLVTNEARLREGHSCCPPLAAFDGITQVSRHFARRTRGWRRALASSLRGTRPACHRHPGKIHLRRPRRFAPRPPPVKLAGFAHGTSFTLGPWWWYQSLRSRCSLRDSSHHHSGAWSCNPQGPCHP